MAAKGKSTREEKKKNDDDQTQQSGRFVAEAEPDVLSKGARFGVKPIRFPFQSYPFPFVFRLYHTCHYLPDT